MAERVLDFLMKGLSIDARQEIYNKFNESVSPTMMKYFLEKEEGYTSFKSSGYTDEEIAQVEEMYSHKFEEINQMMEDNEREPIFSNPADSYVTAQEYVDIFKQRTKEELMERFGTDYAGYQPKVLKKKLEKTDIEPEK